MRKPNRFLTNKRYLVGAILLAFCIFNGAAIVLKSPQRQLPVKSPPPQSDKATSHKKESPSTISQEKTINLDVSASSAKTKHPKELRLLAKKSQLPKANQHTKEATSSIPQKKTYLPTTIPEKAGSSQKTVSSTNTSYSKKPSHSKNISSHKKPRPTPAKSSSRTISTVKKDTTPSTKKTRKKSNDLVADKDSRKKPPTTSKSATSNKQVQPTAKSDLPVITSKVRVTSLSSTETKDIENSSSQPSITPEKPESAKQDEPVSDEYIETAFDMFVGGNYFGFVMLKYSDNWIELLNPQEAISLLPAIRKRQEMLPLFTGRIFDKKDIAKLGSITVNYNNFALDITIAPEQAVKTKIDMDKIADFEGSPTLLARFAANGSINQTPEETSDRYSISNNTRFAYNQHRLSTSGSFNSVNSEYDTYTLQGETDFEVLETPLTLAGGLLDVPGQMFASSISIIGASIFSNRKLYSDDPLLKSNLLEVFVPTRALVEVFKNNANTGQVLFSRMLEFGHTQIDTRKFPRGSYPVEIIISVDGVEQARYVEQFYKHEQIMPRERVELSLMHGKFCDDLEQYNVPVGYGSIRTRITDSLEGNFSFYSIDSRLILSQGLKTVVPTESYGEFILDFNLSGSNRKNILGYSSSVSWSLGKTSGYFSFIKAFEAPPIIHEEINILNFYERKTFNLAMSRSFVLWNRSLSLNFKGSYRKSGRGESYYRYGPSVRYIPYSDKNTSISFSAQHNWTSTDTETMMQVNLTYRFDSIIASSLYNRTQREGEVGTNFQNSIQYNGNQNSPGMLKNFQAKGIYSIYKTDHQDMGIHTNEMSSIDANYKGTTLDISAYANHSSADGHNNFGGEAITTFVAGSSTESLWTGSVPMGSSIIAITLTGVADKEKLISVLINGGHKAYMNIGETAFIEVPVYKESKLELRDADPKTGRFIKIIDPITTVTPYPGNILNRSFEIANIAIISGTLLQHDGTPVDSKFFETGYEPSYTDSEGGFIIEMPIRSKEKHIEFIANNHICSFEIAEVPKDTLVDIGTLKCKLATEQEIKLVRLIHEETRIY